ncbi:S49 family peptidase [Shigella flexneri]
MAASGGYSISTPANYIVANPSTLTGSIGIFGVINTVENSLIHPASTPTASPPRRWRMWRHQSPAA